jgi:peptide chain release factor subunit 1
MPATVQSLPIALRQVSHGPIPGERVLSVYLDTSPQRMARDAYLMAYIDGIKALRASLPAEDAERFEGAAQRAERYLRREFEPGAPGIAIFSSTVSDTCTSVPLPVAPTDLVAWDEAAEMMPLYALAEHLQRVAVALVDSTRARIFTIYLGAIEEQRAIADDVPGKQSTGGWYSLAQTRMARHREEHVARHITHTIDILLDLLHRRPFERLLLGGPPEALGTVTARLPKILRRRLVGTVHLPLFAGDDEVLQAALHAAAEAEHHAEFAAVDELIGAQAGGRAVLGLDATLTALNDRRARRVLLSEPFEHAGGSCPTCDALVIDTERCPICHATVHGLANLREPILRAALAQGAGVEVISGEAAERLAEYGGVGAWTQGG